MEMIKWVFYMLVLTCLAPVVLFLSGLQAMINRVEWEIKFLKKEYQMQYDRIFKGGR